VSRLYPDRPHVGVLAVVRREGRVLLVERAVPPFRGEWGFPGGALELGETIFDAARRELSEETRIEAVPVRVLTALDLIERDEAGRLRLHWALIAVLLDWVAGEAVPNHEASAAGWFDPREMRRLRLMPEVERVMELALGQRGKGARAIYLGPQQTEPPPSADKNP
jgi:8-oxo-dGTP diphosphatase